MDSEIRRVKPSPADPAARRPGALKRALLTTLQLAVTAGILYLLFRDPAKRAEMLQAIKNADGLWLFAGIACYGAVEAIGGLRWLYLLRVQGIRISPPRTFSLVLIGVFFNFVIPGGTGGDVVKTFFLLKETPGKGALALLSVLVDRLIGLFSLILLAGVLISMRWDWLTSSATTARFVWTALVVLGASTLLVLASFAVSGFGLVHKLPERMPGRDKLGELALAYNVYGRKWFAMLCALIVSAIGHIGYFATFYCAARALARPGVRIPSFEDLCIIMPVVNTITSLPISVGGLGVREGLFQIFLGQLSGIGAAVAVVISSTGFLLSAFWGLVGALIYAGYRPSEHARLAAIKQQVAEMEHEVAETEIAMETEALASRE